MASKDRQSLISEFEAVPLERWRARAGDGFDRPRPTIEGPPLRPLYTAADGDSALRPPARSPGWRVALEYTLDDQEALIAALREDQGRGLEVAWVDLHGDLRAGARGPVSVPGVVMQAEVLPELVTALDPGVALHLNAGLGAPAMARALAELREPNAIEDAVLCDPLATLASVGGLGVQLDEVYAGLAETTRWAATHAPSMRTILVDAVAAHDAGASAEQEVAIAIAAGLEHLRQLEAHGISAAQAMPHLALRMAVGGDLLVEVGKLRAVQGLWAKVRAHAGAGEGPPTPLWVRTSWRAATVRDRWINLLRGTVGAVSAIVGGASLVAVQPFTEALGRPDADARRWAVNTQHILRDESHLGAVDDPAAGSFTFEAITDALARAAWDRVRGWLNAGGLAAGLRSGVVQSEIAERAAARSQALATGSLVSVGTTAYANLHEDRPQTVAIPTPEPVLTQPPQITVLPLSRRRTALPFETLRDHADAVTRARGQRPRALLVVAGDDQRARPQLDFARNIAQVGGFDAALLTPEGTISDKIRLVIICGPPDALAKYGPAGIRRLLAAGVGRVLVAGRPTDELRDAGTHDFVHRGRDIVALLSVLHAELLPLPKKADR